MISYTDFECYMEKIVKLFISNSRQPIVQMRLTCNVISNQALDFLKMSIGQKAQNIFKT